MAAAHLLKELEEGHQLRRLLHLLAQQRLIVQSLGRFLTAARERGRQVGGLVQGHPGLGPGRGRVCQRRQAAGC